jgi:lipid-A-disaccharide synthase
LKRVAIVAGEASGDNLGAALIKALKERWPDTEFYGIAGPRMVAEGARALYPMEKLAVRGYVEVLKHLREILAIRAGFARTLLADKPDLFIGIDAPDFNLGLEAKLKAAGVPTVHYVSPSLWAWRPERIHSIGKSVDHMLVLFPFEEEIYRKAKIPVTYVGHPLADEMPLEPDRREARAQLRLATSHVGVALLPGSRLSELEFHADLLIETARELHAKRPELRFFVPLATRETRDYFENRLYKLDARELPITILFGHARLALHACDAALVKSGTATLEAALARCPMVVTYRVSRFTYWLVMRKSVLPFVALPNILENEFVVPELLQEEATAGNLAQALGNWLDNKTARERLRGRFASLHESLAKGHDGRVAQALAPYLNRNNTNNASSEDFAAGPRVAMRGR